MRQMIGAAILFLVIFLHPATTRAQAGRLPQPQRGQRATLPAKPQPPLTLRQVIESLSSPRGGSRAEDLVSKRGVQFQASPAVLDILKEFGASAKLLSMIPVPPVPPPPPKPPAPPVAGALRVICEPRDCAVIVDDKYMGPTSENQKTLTGLHAGDATVEVFADGYEGVTRRIQLPEGKPLEEKFSLKPSRRLRQQSANESLLKAVASLGGIDGVAELGNIEGTGRMDWIDSAGQTQQWAMTFNKRIGKDLVMTFKTKDGQCSASILAQSAKQECKRGLKGGGEKIADQAVSLFLSYQLQDVIHALLKRTVLASERDQNRLESSDGKDSYVLTIGSDSLPVDLVYGINDGNAPIQVRYSNYLNLNSGRYPGRIAIGRSNNAAVWIFTVNSVRSRLARGQ